MRLAAAESAFKDSHTTMVRALDPTLAWDGEGKLYGRQGCGGETRWKKDIPTGQFRTADRLHGLWQMINHELWRRQSRGNTLLDPVRWMWGGMRGGCNRGLDGDAVLQRWRRT